MLIFVMWLIDPHSGQIGDSLTCSYTNANGRGCSWHNWSNLSILGHWCWPNIANYVTSIPAVGTCSCGVGNPLLVADWPGTDSFLMGLAKHKFSYQTQAWTQTHSNLQSAVSLSFADYFSCDLQGAKLDLYRETAALTQTALPLCNLKEL